jgi:hypothetical protein
MEPAPNGGPDEISHRDIVAAGYSILRQIR